ncbi:ATP-binding protein [Ureibacillus sp. 179-F W5.1 NHS]|uniref:histidine kinase n=1 Tax=Lysinibacillus halotolerans TaxID=1368476 RepID=A0A3M8HAE0_9BACI|nr:HAMP domain-containing sensor histidine kinase [Lysinibacillus halotolerans]RNC99403.1 sensor histidine kinase [Lysinibacillus halotolerans]
MSIKNKRVSLLTYWTSRYVLTLCIGLLIISLIFAMWIRHTTLEYRLEMMTFMAEDTVKRITDTPKELPKSIEERDWFNFRDIDPIVYIVDQTGELVSVNRPFNPLVDIDFNELLQNKELSKIKSPSTNETYYVVKKEIEMENEVVGWVFVLETKQHLTEVKQQYGQLAIFIIALGILGWVAIYFLSRRLSRPIMKVAEAAKQVQSGNYHIQLSSSIKENEVYELVSSFKDMASRLQQLEKTRTELLAGVTHELKTPVTSISGLLQAVKDGVVTGDEAEEFIKMALVETTKMKTMVGDLLAFNSFAVDAVPVKINHYEINRLIADIFSQWKATLPDRQIDFDYHCLEREVFVLADLVRIQQIVTNLLTNASQSMIDDGKITITLEEREHDVTVFVKDTGSGINKEDQPFIFERFFRGENKKYTVRGLGLGLPLSKMMAQSIGGDLQLKESNQSGTCFELLLKKVKRSED